MILFRRPVFWAIMIAALFAFTIGSNVDPSCCDVSREKVSRTERESGETGQDQDVAVALSTLLREEDPSSDAGNVDLPAPSQVVVTMANRDGDGGAVLTKGSDGALVVEDGADSEESHVGGPTEAEVETFDVAARPRILSYVVQPGETVSVIADRFNISEETILAANDLAHVDLLREGQQLSILSVDGALHRVQRGESLWDIARMYRADLDEIVEVNEIADPSRVLPAQEIFVPGTQAASIGSTLRSNRVVGSDGRLLKAFSWPVTGRISSRYGMRWGSMHHGIDLAVVTGTAVRASAAGRVSFAGWNGGYGNLVVLDHGDRVETRYAHNSRLVVSAGQRVRRGDVIAYSGNTGRSTGPHVHFEIRRNGQSINPLSYLR